VADSFSAMIADRPYSRGRSSEEACAELERCAGTQFDPAVVALFVAEVRRSPPRADEPILLLHSAPFLHERADAEAHLAELQGGTFAIIAVKTVEGPTREVADALHQAAVTAGGIACRLDETRLAALVPGVATPIADELAAGLGPDSHVTAVIWQPGESGTALIARAQRTADANRTPGVLNRPRGGPSSAPRP